MIFFIPPGFDALLRGFPSEYRHTVWYGVTRTVGYPTVKSLMICLAVSTEYRRVTDRPTDICQSPRYA